MRQSFFEISIIVMLIFLAVLPAAKLGLNLAIAIPLGHAVFLCGVSLFALELARRVNRLLGTLLFGMIVALLGAEITTFALTGLHVNSFTISLLLEGNARENIGIGVALPAFLIGVVLISILLARRRPRKPKRLQLRTTLFAAVCGALFTQLAYALLFFYGTPGVVEVRRQLPFFQALHPYYIERALSPILGVRPQNPFALPNETGGTPSRPESIHIPTPRSVLFVIMDSVRAKDIIANPAIAPNVTILGKTGQQSLNHYSASNCTHFSMFSMFTGTLPTSFGRTRQQGRPSGLVPILQANGYHVSTAEALSLDWYDLSRLLLSGADRHVAQEGTSRERDSFVTQKTIEILSRQTAQPFFHLAYYNGAHFPYGDSEPINGLTGGTINSYTNAISAVDAQVGRITDQLQELITRDNLLVIITSDHGENIFEHGIVGHASALTDEQTIVPLIALNTDNAPLPRSQTDIFGYLLRQLGAAVPHAVQQPQPIILSNCSYEVPSGFAVIGTFGRADFIYEDGFLSPVASPLGHMPPKQVQLEAARQLVNVIEAN
ncbi:sulfatase-like hydrolase/transferase [Kordiimonas sp.]|uniref:sulfatase-like hydrolase/transferase n=1 Tax=Kordiimonas sp. TaxID=1970157 RepID=UPI003A939CF3